MKTIKRSAAWLVGIFILANISGCNEVEEIEKWVDLANQLRIVAKSHSEIVPYRNLQHQALRNYFSEVGSKALALKNTPELTEPFNEAVAKLDLGKVCSKVFVTRAEWDVIMKRCTRNRFYLCAEEVRAYPDMVAVIRSQLNGDHKRKFDRTPACQAAL